MPDMEPGKDIRRMVVAIAGALVVFFGVGIGIYWKIADVSVKGFVHGGPTMLTGAMGGLFGGGLAALVVLVLLLQRH